MDGGSKEDWCVLPVGALEGAVLVIGRLAAGMGLFESAEGGVGPAVAQAAGI
ncbi:hypothetical protein [Streptomyces sp. WELS2]|uniref:hypothetical protein n=1 Tax=Streptomyces sp. WELS2 TaxID=2749435 RepID=UPI0015F09E47|nr:hypothetical protein [Streptomyces sp. WELS2]